MKGWKPGRGVIYQTRQSSCHRSTSQHFNSSRWPVIPALHKRADITLAIFQRHAMIMNTTTRSHRLCPPASQLLTCPPPQSGQSHQSPHPLSPPLRRPPGRAGKVERTPQCERRGSTRTRCRGTCQCHRAAAFHSCAAPWSSWHRPDRVEETS